MRAGELDRALQLGEALRFSPISNVPMVLRL
jgi:hypothetical protein